MSEMKSTNNKIKVDIIRDKPVFNIYFRIFIMVSVLIVCFGIYFNVYYAGVYVIGDSMLPTLTGAARAEHIDDELEDSGDYIYVHRYKKPTYGDIVVLTRRDEKTVDGETVTEKTTIIKRVIAMGGDCVRIENGVVSVKYSGKSDFVPIKEKYVAEERNILKTNFPTVNGVYDDKGYSVEEDCLFLLGDNRDNSLDSRENGGRSFPVADMYGVVTDWSVKFKKFFKFMHYTFGFKYEIS